jgi:hypothetical protein
VISVAGDESQDPIAKLKDRSANKRGAEARKEWLPFGGFKRRRQEREEEAAAEAAAQAQTAPPTEPGAAGDPSTEPLIAPRSQQGIATDRGPRLHGPAVRKARRRGELEIPEGPTVSVAPPPLEPAPLVPAAPTTAAIEDLPSADGGFDRPAPLATAPVADTPSIPVPVAVVPEESPPLAPEEPAETPPIVSTAPAETEWELPAAPSKSSREMYVPRSRATAQVVPPSPPVIETPPEPILPEPEPEPEPVAESPPARDVDTGELPLPKAQELVMPPEPLTNAPLKLRKISEIQPFRGYSPDGGPVRLCPPPEGLAADATPPRCPEEHELPLFGSLDRDFIGIEYCWEASNIFYRPLYFEDFALERYGHTYNEAVQSVVSLGKFGLQVVGLPYQLVLDKPDRKDYPLGYYRPGDCAPYKCYQIPLNAEAATVAAGVYTGAAFVFP